MCATHVTTERLKSFENWPTSFITPSVMATAGFYYLNTVDCFNVLFCGIKV